jgi:hypothetical protein
MTTKTVVHTDKYAQSCLDALTSRDRNERFSDGAGSYDRGAWFDLFEDLWGALAAGAKVRCESLGQSSVAGHDPYGMDRHELRPTKILSSHNPRYAALEYAIMTADHTADDGKPPYVMVCYSAKTGNELDRINL